MKLKKLLAGLAAVYALACILWALDIAPPDPEPSQGWTLTAWNDLGMHCMDEDFSIFSILPPFNTINAQLIDKNGERVTGADGVHLYYQSATDPGGSETHSSSTGTNFWEHEDDLFGGQIAEDTGLFGAEMPGPSNTPREMEWKAAHNWWAAEGIPIIPHDKFGDKNAYPLIRVTARNTAGDLLAETMIVAPVSDEMNCITCHKSGGTLLARPTTGWLSESDHPESDPIRDYRLNILRLHDARQAANPAYASALSNFGFNPDGLEATVLDDQKSILCASCHSSNALGTPGFASIPPLTQAMHAGHVNATDPVTGITLGDSLNRTSCYQCHPGKQTRCLRGAMGRTFDDDGQPLMSCQSCHGGMAEVGHPTRAGWFDEPTCQSCHTGTYTNNAGQVRFTDSFVSPGVERTPADDRFATDPDTPAAGFSLFRFSNGHGGNSGHGGLACSACHGSPHAIYPTSERNDNLQSQAIQGHIGTISECSACHQNDTHHTRTVNGGPHGMHGVGDWWAKEHHDHAKSLGNCKACHGLDLKGGVLSEALAPRRVKTAKGGPYINYWQGQRVSCYDCHNGPDSSDSVNKANKPVVQDFTITTAADTTAAATLLGTDANSSTLAYRIVEPPKNGTLAIDSDQVIYTPNPGFSGTDVFTYCARDNRTDSNLGVVHIEVGPGANTADNDNDGIPDLIERAFGLDTARLNRGSAPNWQIHDDNAGNKSIQAIYDPALVPPDLQLVFEASDDLGTDSWNSSHPSLTTTTDTRGRSVVRLALPPTAPAKAFIRCRVETR